MITVSLGTAPATSEQSDFTSGLREDLLHHDPLLDCLVELTRLHGRPSTRAALSAGLPLEKGVSDPFIVSRAALRAGLSSKIVRRSLDGIDHILLPVILLLKGDEACVLLGWNDAGDTAQLLSGNRSGRDSSSP